MSCQGPACPPCIIHFTGGTDAEKKICHRQEALSRNFEKHESDAVRKSSTSRDICTKFITPALAGGGKRYSVGQIREEVSFTKDRVIVHGEVSVCGEPKRADYVLSYKPGLPLAVVEANPKAQTACCQSWLPVLARRSLPLQSLAAVEHSLFGWPQHPGRSDAGE
jgi:hypothetical protein